MNYPRLDSKDETERKLAFWLLRERKKFHKGELSPSQHEKFKTLPHSLIYIKDTSTLKKNQLIEMAESGKEKPNGKDNPLLGALRNYINKKSDSYDAVFENRIKTVRPDWLNKPAWKKEQLLKLAENKDQRKPYFQTALGYALWNYTNPARKAYDAEFDKNLRSARPDWFENATVVKKTELLRLAKKNEPRPNKSHPLGIMLCAYICKKHKNYDPIFDKEIREVGHRWFADKALEKKQSLLALAAAKEKRPVFNKHPLGAVLCHYTNPNNSCYDPIFDKEVKKLAPEWF